MSSTSVTRNFNMVGSYENADAAAALLAETNTTIIKFLRVLSKKYHIDETDDYIAAHEDAHNTIVHADNDLYNMIDHLLDNYDPDAFYENDPRVTNETSYTLNKGTRTHVCLREKADPRILVDKNDLFFVMLHECAHMANYRDWGHGPKFWAAFKWILHEAVESGIYTPRDYAKKPINYCGIEVSYQPLFDENLPQLWR